MVFAIVFDGRAVEFAVQHAVSFRYRVRDDHARVRVALAFTGGHHNARGRLFLRLVREEHAAFGCINPIVDFDEDVVGDGLQGSADGGVVERVVAQARLSSRCRGGNESERCRYS